MCRDDALGTSVRRSRSGAMRLGESHAHLLGCGRNHSSLLQPAAEFNTDMFAVLKLMQVDEQAAAGRGVSSECASILGDAAVVDPVHRIDQDERDVRQ
jgi:hypothetical protein